MNNDEKFMRIAITQAQIAKKAGNLPFGSVVVLKDKIVGLGYSSEVKDNDVTAHAETKAVSEACRTLGRIKLTECTIYASGEPCNMCASAIFQAKIPRVVIGSTRDELPNIFRKRRIRIENLAEDSGYDPEIIFGVLKSESIDLFTDIKLR